MTQVSPKLVIAVILSNKLCSPLCSLRRQVRTWHLAFLQYLASRRHLQMVALLRYAAKVSLVSIGGLHIESGRLSLRCS